MDISKSIAAKEGNVNSILNNDTIGNLSDLTHDIQEEQEKLSKTLEDLKSNTSVPSIETNFFGIAKKSSIENSMLILYSDMCGYIRECGSAVKSTNDNLIKTLDLLKILALAEKSLFDHIDDQVVSNNELKDILLDWFKEQGITNDNVKELIETSFQRAYTLRNRINIVRNEYRNELAKFDERIIIFEKKHESLDSEIKKIVHDTTEQLHEELRKNVESLNELQGNLSKDIEMLASEKLSLLTGLSDSINSRFEEQENKLNQKLQEIERLYTSVKDIAASTKKISEEYEQKLRLQSEKQSQNLTGIANQTKENLNQTINKNNEHLSSFSSSLRDEFKQKMEKQRTEFEEREKRLLASIKKKSILTLIGTAALSSLLSYLIATLF